MNIVVNILNFILNIQIFEKHDRGTYTPKQNENKEVAWVKQVLLIETIKGYIAGDLKRLTGIKVIEGYNGNANFPIALYTFSCMDFLGFLIADTHYGLTGNTNKKIKAYIEKTFTVEDQEKLQPHMSYLVNIFRNGLTHNFFPKIAGISRTNAEVFTKSPQGGYIVLDADQLVGMFLRSVSNLEMLLEDDNLCKQIYSRYQDILTDHQTTTTNTSTSSSIIPTGTAMGTATVQPPQDLQNLPKSQGDTGCAGV